MKKSIARKIEQLMTAMKGNENYNEPQNTAFRSEDSDSHFVKHFGEFCRRIPVSIIQFIRPNQRLDLQ
jgi:hypothetical protein